MRPQLTATLSEQCGHAEARSTSTGARTDSAPPLLVNIGMRAPPLLAGEAASPVQTIIMSTRRAITLPNGNAVTRNDHITSMRSCLDLELGRSANANSGLPSCAALSATEKALSTQSTL
jgi:hypothetical protein